MICELHYVSLLINYIKILFYKPYTKKKDKKYMIVVCSTVLTAKIVVDEIVVLWFLCGGFVVRRGRRQVQRVAPEQRQVALAQGRGAGFRLLFADTRLSGRRWL